MGRMRSRSKLLCILTDWNIFLEPLFTMSTGNDNPFQSVAINPTIRAAATQKINETETSKKSRLNRSAIMLREAAVSLLHANHQTSVTKCIPDENALTRLKQLSPSERAETYGPFQDVQRAIFFEYVISVVRGRYSKNGQPDTPISHHPRLKKYGESEDDNKFFHGSFIPVSSLFI
jgi:hypothetical protein